MKNLRHLFWYVKKYKNKYIIGVLSLLFCNVVIPIPIWAFGKVVDLIKDNTLTYSTLFYYSSLVIGALIILYILEYIWHYYIFGHSFQAGRDNRRRLLSKILKQNPVFFYKNSTGSLMNKATQDISAIQNIMGLGILTIFDGIVWPIILIGIMGVTISWTMTILSIIILPIIILVTMVLGKKIRIIYLKTQKLFEKLNETVMENITSVRVIKGFSTQKETQSIFEKSAKDLYEAQLKQGRISALFMPTFIVIPTLSFVISLFVGEHLISHGKLTLGQMFTFFFYLNMMVWPMIALGLLVNIVQEASASLARLEKTYTYKEDLIESQAAIECLEIGSIEFKNFSFKFPDEEKYALKNINVKINKGETLGVVGKIGSGKTTFIKQLLRFYQVEEGDILFNDNPVEDYTIKSIRDKMGYVPQQHSLFSKSVYDNIKFGKKDATEEDVMEAIEFADFTKDLDTLPKGLETIIGEKGISISGGQKQRISISRAVIKKPEVLILDDSLSAVDSLTEKKIISNIVDKRKGKTNIIVAHRLSGLMHADNIIVLEKGEIVESGTHEELLKNKAWYYKQYQTQKLGGIDA